jgi:light-regulated signal transduction histidine kinase (bacteriophytochrome)
MVVAGVDMNVLVQEALKELAFAAEGRQLSVDVEPLPEIVGDAPMLRRAWIGLLENAINATASNPRGRIEIGATREANETIYFVKDNGVGAETESIGEPLEGSPRSPGVDELPVTTGGLAVAKHIIGSHHGRLWRKVEANAGTTLFFSLPSKDRRR